MNKRKDKIFPIVTNLKIILNTENGGYQVSIILRFHWIYLKELTYEFKMSIFIIHDEMLSFVTKYNYNDFRF